MNTMPESMGTFGARRTVRTAWCVSGDKSIGVSPIIQANDLKYCHYYSGKSPEKKTIIQVHDLKCRKFHNNSFF
jgi:hypothetical protein